MLRDPASVAAAWLAKAESDRRTIDILCKASDPPWDMVAFHAQQLAEKSLKALLAGRGVAFPRTHDLSLLVSAAGGDLGILPDDPGLVELSLLAVSPRYPDEPEPVDAETALRAVAAATRIHATVERLIGYD